MMPDMEEGVTRSLVAEYQPDKELSTQGDWQQIRIMDLVAAGYTHIAFHFPHDQETPNAANLFGAPDA